MISVNQLVMPRVKELVDNAEALGCNYYRLENGTHVVDMGIDVPGGWEAAKLFTEIDMAYLGRMQYGTYELEGGLTVPTVEVYVDNPHLGCLLSQIAGLQLSDGEFAAIGSGPARALAVNENDHCFKYHSYRDLSNVAVLGVQMTVQPDVDFAELAAKECKVAPENLYLLVHPTTSIVASVQISARIIEQTINMMIKKGFDLDQIVFARGRCIIAPVVLDEIDAMGKTNDCLLYGGESDIWVKGDDETIAKHVPKLVTENAKDYGTPFKDLFVEAGCNFYNMDLDIHSPAKVQIYNMNTGNVFHAGKMRDDIMFKSLFNNK